MSTEDAKKEEKELTTEQKVTARNEALAALNFEKVFVWRETQTDGMMPVRNFTESYAEKTKKEQKDEKADLGEQKDPIFVDQIAKIHGFAGHMADKEKKQAFELNSTVYAKDLDCYV